MVSFNNSQHKFKFLKLVGNEAKACQAVLELTYSLVQVLQLALLSSDTATCRSTLTNKTAVTELPHLLYATLGYMSDSSHPLGPCFHKAYLPCSALTGSSILLSAGGTRKQKA